MPRQIDQRLNQAMRLMANGVFVIAAAYDGQVRGFTATWVTQVSYDHPLVAVSVSKSHHTYHLIERSGEMVINILAASQADVARHFGHKSHDNTHEDRRYFQVTDGVETPILVESLASLRCRVTSSCDARDHTVFVVEVTEAAVRGDDEPLLYWPRNGFLRR
ncbi:MAG: flavin reductase [Chloroflexota bacterium]|nr:MAG: flavin reductase [Chloroflexota bacterium]